jgi:hypothetical protein
MDKLVDQFGQRQETLTNKTTTADKQTHAIRVLFKLLKNPIDHCAEEMEKLFLERVKKGIWLPNSARI